MFERENRVVHETILVPHNLELETVTGKIDLNRETVARKMTMRDPPCHHHRSNPTPANNDNLHEERTIRDNE